MIDSLPGGRSCRLVQVRPPYARSAGLYDVLLGRSMLPLFVRNFEALARLYGLGARTAADVGCGTGAFVRHLLGRGIRAVGVDASPAMIREARRRTPGAGGMFFVQDLLRLRLPFRVDVITCNFDVLNYCLRSTDLLKAFCRFRRNLVGNGWLMFDMIVGNGLPMRPKRKELVIITPDLVSRWTISWNPREGVRKVVMLHAVGPKRHSLERETHVQRWYPVEIIMRALFSSGFMLLGVHGVRTLRTATIRDTRVVFIAQRMPDPNGS